MKRFVVFCVSMSIISLFVFIFLSVNYWTPSLEIFFNYVSIIFFIASVVAFSYYMSKFLMARKHDKLKLKGNYDDIPEYLKKADVFDEEEGFKLFLCLVAIVLIIPWLWFSLLNILHLN